MRILMTADAVGGVWTYSVALIRALPDHEFVLATLGPRPTGAQRAAVGELSNVTLAESDWKLEWMEGGHGDIVGSGNWLLQLEAEWRPDVVHLNGFAHGALPFAAPVLVVAHSCVCSWWRAVKQAEAPGEWNPYRQAVARGLNGAAMVVALSLIHI